jgi:hypothetical protein
MFAYGYVSPRMSFQYYSRLVSMDNEKFFESMNKKKEFGKECSSSPWRRKHSESDGDSSRISFSVLFSLESMGET